MERHIKIFTGLLLASSHYSSSANTTPRKSYSDNRAPQLCENVRLTLRRAKTGSRRLEDLAVTRYKSFYPYIDMALCRGSVRACEGFVRGVGVFPFGEWWAGSGGVCALLTGGVCATYPQLARSPTSPDYRKAEGRPKWGYLLLD